jgi:DNA-binding beta-propeller fold protein YncE
MLVVRRLGVAAGLCLALVVIAAGCSSGSPRPARPGLGALRAGAPRLRGCSAATSVGSRLDGVRTSMVALTGSPFGVVTTADGRWSFVSSADKVAVMSDQGFAPRLVRSVSLPGFGLGEVLTHDGQYLLVAEGSGAVVLSVTGLEHGVKDPVLGVMSSSGGAHGGGGAIEVSVTPDDGFAFVTLEGAAEIATFDLRLALAHRFHASGFIGAIPVGEAPVGMAISPDGRWLYATSEVAGRAAGPTRGQGTLSVVDLRRAETRPSGAVIATARARCSPVRVAVSPDGRTVWVTARESNTLLGFSAAKLTSDPGHALAAAVTVGQSPVGLAFVDGGRRIVVADSNRFGAPGVTTGLTVVDPSAALAGRPAVRGTIRAGKFPREMSLEPNRGTLLVTNFASGQLEAVDTRGLP